MIKLKDLFKPKYGVNLELDKCEQANGQGTVNFVARTSQNNGVVARVKLIDGLAPQPAGTLSLAVSGSVLSCFVQDEPYYSGRDLYVLTPKTEMTHMVKLFYAHAISMNAYRYSYGRAANKTMPDIELPDLKDAIEFSKGFSEFDHSSAVAEKQETKPSILDTENWKVFRLGDLFKCLASRNTNAEDLEKGTTPYVSRTAMNNSIAGFVDSGDRHPYPGNCISIGCESAFAAYQAEPFLTGNKIYRLYNKRLNKYSGIFICSVINNDHYKWSYGRGFFLDKVKEDEIKLPEKNGEPDWEAMENFIKALPYSDRI